MLTRFSRPRRLFTTPCWSATPIIHLPALPFPTKVRAELASKDPRASLLSPIHPTPELSSVTFLFASPRATASTFLPPEIGSSW